MTLLPIAFLPLRFQTLTVADAPLSDEPPMPPADAFTQLDKPALQALEQREAKIDTRLSSQLDAAQARVDAAAKELAPGQLPTQSVAQLQQQKAALAERQARSVLPALKAQKQAVEAEVAQAAIVKKQHGNRMLDGPGGIIANLEGALQQQLQAKDPAAEHTKRRLDGCKADLRALDSASAVVARGTQAGATLDKQIAAAEAMGAGQARQSTLLDKQIAYAQAKASAEGLKTQLGQVRTTQGSLKSAQTAIQCRDDAALKVADEVTTDAQEAYDDAKGMVSNGSIREYQKAAFIKKSTDEGKLKGKNVNTRHLADVMGKLENEIHDAAQKREGTAREVVRQMQSPTFVQALSRMDDGPRATLVGRMLKSIEGTKTGDDFLKQALVPLVGAVPERPAEKAEGSAEPRELPEAKNPFSAIFKQGGTASETALAVLEQTGGFIAKQSKVLKRPELLEDMVKLSIALKPGQLKVVEEATALANSGKLEDAKKLLEEKGIATVAKSFERISQSLTALGALAAFAELAADPNLSTALEATKSTAELTKVLTQMAQKLPAFQKYEKLLGTTSNVADRVAAPVAAVIALHDMWKEDGTVNRGDQGGTIGNSLVATGAIVTTAGLALDGTGIGAVAGVPLNVFGTVMMGAGAGVDLVFGDNDTQKWLKKNAPEYLKW